MSPKQARRINEITPSEALVRCIEHREIFHDEMLHLMRMLMRGEMSPVMSAALLMGLRVKKETVGEIAAAASVMREFCLNVPIPNPDQLLDMRSEERRVGKECRHEGARA